MIDIIHQESRFQTPKILDSTPKFRLNPLMIRFKNCKDSNFNDNNSIPES
ncbi:hypothetical protein [Helicobacter pullorum]|nr:hypothetical protein [Helicobacter pullorum]HJF82874.1 hypothetical protein [Helicobacter pullorum]